MKLFDVTCPDPECNEEFEAEIPDEALLPQSPDADPFTVDCPECDSEWAIVYDPASGTVTLEDLDDDLMEDEADETDLEESESGEEENT